MAWKTRGKAVTYTGSGGCIYYKGTGPDCTTYPLIFHEGKSVRVSRLRLSERLGRPLFPRMMALHTCDHPACINVDHLYEGTHQDNADDRMRRGRHIVRVGADHWTAKKPDCVARGSKAGPAKLLESDVLLIRARAVAGESQLILAAAFDVGRRTVNNIVNRDTWVHI